MHLSIDEAWKRLRRTAAYAPDHLRASSDTRHYQFFEVAVTLVLSSRLNALPWTVTPVANDAGFDFKSEISFIDKSDSVLLDPARVIVGGQCKVPNKAGSTVSKAREVHDRFVSDLAWMKDAEIFIACLAAIVTPDARGEARESLRNGLRRPVELITLGELQTLFRRHKAELRRLMDKFYDADEAEAILAVITASHDGEGALVDLAATPRPEINCGEAFEIQATVNGPPSILRECRLSYVAVTGESGLRLLNRVAVERPLGGWSPYPQSPTIPLRFVTFRPGMVNLGRVEVRDGDVCLASCELGTATANDTFTPPFFDGADGIRHVLDEIARNQKECRAGKPRYVAVIGRGGNGKSRICAEAALRAEDAGAVTLSLPHPRHLKAPYQILADLVDNLVPPAGRQPHGAEGILQFVRTYNAELADAAAETVRFLEMQATGAGDLDAGGRLCPGACARLISFLVALRTQVAPLFLHLSDMHWTAPEVLSILGNALRLLGSANNVRAIIVLEGRNKELLEFSSDVGSAPAFAVFEEFATEIGACAVVVPPLTGLQTAAFLDHLFEDRQANAALRSDNRLDRREAELKAYLARKAGGNPMHVIEVLRLLRAQGQIQVNHLSNRFFALDRLDLASPIPGTVTETIIARFRYLDQTNPDLAKLLSALAVHKDRCSKETLRRLRERFAPTASDDDLRSTEFVSVAGESKFQHELYYEILHRNILLEEGDLLDALDVHLGDDDLRNWGRGAVSGVELGRLLQMHPTRRFEARSVLHKAAEVAKNQNLTVVQRDALGLLVDQEAVIGADQVTDTCIQDFVGQVRLRVEFAETNLWHGDRIKSVDVLQDLCDVFASVPHANLPLSLELFERQHVETLISYGNASLNQFRAHRAIEALERALDHLAPWCDGQRQEEPGFAAWIGLKQRALNRLGVACRIEGDPVRALLYQNAVFDEYEYGATPEKFVYHLDRARTVGLSDPVKGAGLLRQALQVDRGDESPDKQACLAENSLISVSLVCHTRGLGAGSDQPLPLADMALHAQTSYFRARRAALVLETCGAALVAGAVAAVEGKWPQALEWFEDCRDESLRHNHLELLWKAHVNAAQAALQIAGRAERAQEHLQAATRLIVDQDLGPRTARQRQTRMFVCGLSLAQLQCMAERLEDVASIARLRPLLGGADIVAMRDGARGRTEFICVGESDLMLL